MADVDPRQGAVTAWLAEAEKAFANFGTIFEEIMNGKRSMPRDRAEKALRAAKEFESQARQLRALMMDDGRGGQH